MSRSQYTRRFDLALAVKKWLLSGFVIFSFLAYVIHERLGNSKQAASAAPSGQGLSAPGASLASSRNGQPSASSQALPQAAAPQLFPTPAPAPGGMYKDGTYAGTVADAFYGNVQVQVVIQGGKLADVQVLQYPSDRRTSQFINSQALPWLKQEAVQAQSANIDFISGATLTSDAFTQSLDTALQSARS